MPGIKYRFVFGPPVDRFAPNTNFIIDEAFPGMLEDDTEANLKELQTVLKGFRKFEQAPFKTAAGQVGIKLTTQAESNGKVIRQSYYFFETSKGKKLVVTCSASVNGREMFDPVFEGSVTTLQIAK